MLPRRLDPSGVEAGGESGGEHNLTRKCHKHVAALAGWRAAPAGPSPLTEDERDLLDAIALARRTRNYLPLNRCGGVLEAAKAAARVQAQQQPDAAPPLPLTAMRPPDSSAVCHNTLWQAAILSLSGKP